MIDQVRLSGGAFLAIESLCVLPCYDAQTADASHSRHILLTQDTLSLVNNNAGCNVCIRFLSSRSVLSPILSRARNTSLLGASIHPSGSRDLKFLRNTTDIYATYEYQLTSPSVSLRFWRTRSSCESLRAVVVLRRSVS